MSDEVIINDISSSIITNQEDDGDVRAIAPQVTEQDKIDIVQLGLQRAEENGAS